MTYTIIQCEQRTPEWFEAKLGVFSASEAGEMLSSGKGSAESVGRRNLRINKALERITRIPARSKFVTPAMEEGTRREDESLGYYEAMTGEVVSRVGFIRHATHQAGYSPDGVIYGPDSSILKNIELKNPEPLAHLSYLRTGDIGKDYRAQVVHGLWITGAKSCDWMSYQPQFPERLRSKLITIHRDEQEIHEYEVKALAFLAEVDREVTEINGLDMAF